jgi:putative selenate reductase
MYLTSQDRFEEALKVIQDSNPFPNATGMACDHTCEDKCTRMNYDSTLLIRDIKRFNAKNGTSTPLSGTGEMSSTEALTHLNGKSAAIIGGGPSGMSAAYYLAKTGFKVDVYEAKEKAGGMLANSIPEFRLYDYRLEADVERIKALGVNVHTNYYVTKEKFNSIKEDHDYVHISIGAASSKKMGIKGEDSKIVMGFLEFLEKVHKKEITRLDGNIAIIGGGNSAMDAARTAWRLVENGTVKLVYRRTQEEMPADREELEALLEEKIEVMELTNPVAVRVEGLECVKMELGAPDESGRRRPVVINGSNHLVEADLVIMAIGQDTVLDFLDDTTIEKTRWGTIAADSITHETTIENIYTGGDVNRGPASIIKAIADGKEVAFEIMKKEGIYWDKYIVDKEFDKRELKVKKATRVEGVKLPHLALDLRKSFEVVIKDLSQEQAKAEASRCLLCDEVCDVCTTVCPNRANIAYKIEPKDFIIFDLEVRDGELNKNNKKTFRTTQVEQVLNIGDFCNECGDCSTFCPTSGNPYLDKPKFYLTELSYNAESNNAWRHNFKDGKHCVKVKYSDFEGEMKLISDKDSFLYEDNFAKIIFEKETLEIKETTSKKDGKLNMDRIANMALILKAFEKRELLF